MYSALLEIGMFILHARANTGETVLNQSLRAQKIDVNVVRSSSVTRADRITVSLICCDPSDARSPERS